MSTTDEKVNLIVPVIHFFGCTVKSRVKNLKIEAFETAAYSSNVRIKAPETSISRRPPAF